MTIFLNRRDYHLASTDPSRKNSITPQNPVIK